MAFNRVDKSYARAKRFDTETKTIGARMPLTSTCTMSPMQTPFRHTGATKFFDSNAFNSTH